MQTINTYYDDYYTKDELTKITTAISPLRM